MPRLLCEMYVIRKQALDISAQGSETSSTGGQNHCKTDVSLRCRGDTSGEAAQGRAPVAAPAETSMQKIPWYVQGRDGTAPWEDVSQDCTVLPPRAPSLLQLPAWTSTWLVQPTAKRGWKRDMEDVWWAPRGAW